jgi:hypothetical protein
MPSALGQKIITPDQYLDLAVNWSESVGSSSELLIVKGTVDLRKSSTKNKIRILPPAKIEGDLLASDSPALEEVCCEVRNSVNLDGSGVHTLGPGFVAHASFSANRCHRLKKVEGRFPSEVELEESGVQHLTRNFRCAGDLYISDCDQIETLDCFVGGSVFANRSTVSRLGENFSCAGELHLTACENIKEVSKINGPPTTVYLASSGVERILEDFACSDSLVVKDNYRLVSISGTVGQSSNIESAPLLEKIAKLHSRKSLSVSNCPTLREVDFSTNGPACFHRCGMPCLSKASRSKGELSIVDCQNFRQLGGEWSGDVTLVDLPALQTISEDFICDQDMTIRKCPDLVRLSGRVRGRANLVGLGVLENMGEDLVVIGDLVVDAADTRLKSIGCLVGGTATIVNAPMLESTSREFKVGLSARFQSCPQFKILRGRVHGDTVIKQGTRVEKIGADFECGGNLTIADCPPVENINCAIGGDLILERTLIKKTGPAFRCSGKIIADHPWPHACAPVAGCEDFVPGLEKKCGALSLLSGKTSPQVHPYSRKNWTR